VKAAAKKGIPHFHPRVPKAPPPLLHLDLPPPPRLNTPNKPLTLAIEEPPPDLNFIPPWPKPKEPVDPKPVDAPNSLYSSWTNSSSILDKKKVNVEFNEQISSGTAGTTVTSQLSGRVGVGGGVELGVVGNLSLADPVAGAGGATVHLGTTDLDEDKYASGAIFQVTGGKGEDPSGNSSGVLAASGSYLAAKGGDKAPYETDLNLGASYATFGTFGPGATSSPDLLSVQGLALRNWYLDPRHANSAFAEALAAPTVALGTVHDSTPLYGLRVGAGAGFSTTGTGSLLTFSANAFLDATSRGVGAGGAFTITYGWKPGASPDQ
jgi:hypothetical protein